MFLSDRWNHYVIIVMVAVLSHLRNTSLTLDISLVIIWTSRKACNNTNLSRMLPFYFEITFITGAPVDLSSASCGDLYCLFYF